VLKKTIKYKNLFTDEEMEGDFYFHLSKAEIAELELSVEGGLSEALKRIIESKDNKEIFAEFKHIVLEAYGVRSEDGTRFIKNQKVREEFESSEAFSELLIEILTDEDKAAEFVNGIIPADLAEQVAQLNQDETKTELAPVPDQDESKNEVGSIRQNDEAGKGDN